MNELTTRISCPVGHRYEKPNNEYLSQVQALDVRVKK